MKTIKICPKCSNIKSSDLKDLVRDKDVKIKKACIHHCKKEKEHINLLINDHLIIVKSKKDLKKHL